MKVSELDFTKPLPDGDHWAAPGLLLRVRGVSKSWVLRFTGDTGRRREMGLGAFRIDRPDDAAEQIESAKRSAHGAREAVARGVDPINERDQRKLAAKVEALRTRGLTVRRAVRLYYDHCIEPKVSYKYARQWLFRVENDAPEWLLELPAVDLTSHRVLAALDSMQVRSHPRAKAATLQDRKDKLRQRMDQVSEWLIRGGTLDANPVGVRRNTRPHWRHRFDGDRPGAT